MLKLMEIGASRLESAQKPGRAESDFLSVLLFWNLSESKKQRQAEHIVDMS